MYNPLKKKLGFGSQDTQNHELKMQCRSYNLRSNSWCINTVNISIQYKAFYVCILHAYFRYSKFSISEFQRPSSLPCCSHINLNMPEGKSSVQQYNDPQLQAQTLPEPLSHSVICHVYFFTSRNFPFSCCSIKPNTYQQLKT